MREWFLRPAVSLVDHDLKMELDSMEWIQIDLLGRGHLEPLLDSLFHRKLGAGDTFVDVGSHIGFYSLLARHYVGETGRVIAVEPQPYNANRLLRNAELNGFTNIEVHVSCAGNLDQYLSLPNQAITDKARLSLGGEHVNDTAQRFVVPLRRMEDILREAGVGNIQLMKISVVGYENEVVRGLGRLLGQVENLVIDIREDTTRGRVKELIELLRGANYSLTKVTGESWQPGQSLPANCLLASLTK